MTEEEIKNELDEIVTWKKVSDVNRMYRLYRIIFNDKGHICSKCSRVIRNVHQKLVNYNKQRYGSQEK